MEVDLNSMEVHAKEIQSCHSMISSIRIGIWQHLSQCKQEGMLMSHMTITDNT